MHKPLPCALILSAKPALGLERGAPVIEHHHPIPGPWSEPPPDVAFSSLLCIFVSLSLLLVRVALKIRLLGLHPPRLCRLAVFLIQTNELPFCHLAEIQYNPEVPPQVKANHS